MPKFSTNIFKFHPLRSQYFFCTIWVKISKHIPDSKQMVYPIPPHNFLGNFEMTIEELIKVKSQLLFILGVTLPMLMQHKCQTSKEQEIYDWIMESIAAVVYRNEELPGFPK